MIEGYNGDTTTLTDTTGSVTEQKVGPKGITVKKASKKPAAKKVAKKKVAKKVTKKASKKVAKKPSAKK